MTGDADRLLIAQLGFDVRSAARDLKKMRKDMDGASTKMQKRWRETTQRMSRDTNDFANDVRRAVAGIGVGLAVQNVTSLADEWTSVENKIKAAAVASETAAIPAGVIADLARDTNTSLTATADLYTRVNRSVDASVNSQLAFVRAMNQAAVASGATAQETASTILQLSQALQSGVLQGEELRSLRENAPLVIAAIANEMNVAKGAIKDLGAEGKITSDIVFNAVLNYGDEIEKQFNAITPTLSTSIQNLQTAATEYAGTVDSALGVTGNLSGFISSAAEDVDLFGDSLLVAVTLLGSAGLGKAIGSSASNFKSFAVARYEASIQSIEASRGEAKAAVDAAREAEQARAKAVNQLEKASLKRQKLYDDEIKDNKDYINAKVAAAKADDKLKNARIELDREVRRGNISVSQAKLHLAEMAGAETEAARAKKNSKGVSEAYSKAIFAENQAKIKHRESIASLDVATQKYISTNKRGTLAFLQLKKVGATAMSFFGGPLGLAITAAGAAMAYFNSQSIKKERAVRSVDKALSLLASQTVDTTNAENLSAEAAKELEERRNAQAKATAALAKIEKDRNKLAVQEGARNAKLQFAKDQQLLTKQKVLVDKLKREAAGTNSAIGATALFADLQIAEGRLLQLEESLAQTKNTAELFSEAMKHIDSLEFSVPTSNSGSVPPGGVGEIKKELDAIDAAFRQVFETERQEIKRTLNEQLKAIDEVAVSEEEKNKSRQKAWDVYSFKMSEVTSAELKQKEDAAKAELAIIEELRLARLDATGSVIEAEKLRHNARLIELEDEISDQERLNQAKLELEGAHQEKMKELRNQALGIGDGEGMEGRLEQVWEENDQKFKILSDALAQKEITLQEYSRREVEIAEETANEIRTIQMNSRSVILTAYRGLFESLSGMLTAWGDDSSAAYKVLFGISKAFAIADASIKISQAMMGAFSEGVTMPDRIAKMSLAATQGASIMSAIQGTNFAKGGIGIRGPGNGTSDHIQANISRGESVITEKGTSLNSGLLAMINRGVNVEGALARMAAPQIVQQPAVTQVNVYTPPGMRATQQQNGDSIDITIEELAGRIEQGGDAISNSLENTYGLSRAK